MTTLVAILLSYLLGGLTFIPILLALFLYHAHLTQPIVDAETFHQRDSLQLGPAEEDAARQELENLPAEISQRLHESDVASGYFVVSREFTPSIMTGKPAERTPLAASAPAGSSPSVYQSMYRSIFERGRTQSPSLDAAPKGNKKARNTFFVVIRSAFAFVPAWEHDTDHGAQARHSNVLR
jgi:hypothetical protein